MFQLKGQLNGRDQQARDKSLRLFGIATVSEEAATGQEASKALAKKVYKILEPILVGAQANGDIVTVSQQATILEDCFRVGSWSPTPHNQLYQQAAQNGGAPSQEVEHAAAHWRQ